MSCHFLRSIITVFILSFPLQSNSLTGEINKHRIEGEVTVYVSQQALTTLGSRKIQASGFVLTEKIMHTTAGTNSIIKSKIENEGDAIRPFQTDSIIINGMTAYPEPDGTNWLFPYYKGRVTIYACHPNIRALLHYKEQNDEFKELPKRLLTSKDTISTFGILSVDPTWVADSLSRFPLLFCMYKYDPVATIRQFNELDESKLLPVDLALEITPQIYSIFKKRANKLEIDTVQKLLEKAPTDMILNCKMAELKLLEHDDLVGAKEHLEIAKRSANSEEYLVYYVDGLVLQESGHYEEALTAYYKSLQYSSEYGGDEMKKFRKMLNKLIAKVQKKV